MADSKVDTASDPLFGKPLLGVSKHSYNAGLLYEKYGFTSRLTYTWRSKFNEGQFGCLLAPPNENGMAVAACDPGVPPSYNRVKAYGRLDLSLGYQFNEHLSMNVNANNLTGSKYYSYFQNESFPHDIRSDDKFYGPALLNAGGSGRSPEGTAMLAGSTGKHIANRAGSGAAQRSARIATRMALRL
eukprot:gene11578-14146_t